MDKKASLANENVKKTFELQKMALQILKTIDTTVIPLVDFSDANLVLILPLYVNTPLDRSLLSANNFGTAIPESQNSVLRKNIYYLSRSVEDVPNLITQLVRTWVISMNDKARLVRKLKRI